MRFPVLFIIQEPMVSLGLRADVPAGGCRVLGCLASPHGPGAGIPEMICGAVFRRVTLGHLLTGRERVFTLAQHRMPGFPFQI